MAFFRDLVHVSAEDVGVGVAVFLGSLLVSIGVTTALVVRMPQDYFRSDAPPVRSDQPLPLRLALLVGRNLLGAALVALGLLMSLPGVPGQGLLTVLIGLLIADVPGKRRLERRLIRIQRLFAAVNALRVRFGRPPFDPPESPA